MRIAANGTILNYELTGLENAPLVMLSHSLGASSAMWDAQIEILEKKYRVLRYDTRGHGESDAPDEVYSLDILGDDAVALMDELDIDEVHWVGLSMGGMIGQNLALRAPNRLVSLALCDTAAQVSVEGQKGWDERISLARQDGMKALSQPTMERWFTAAYLETTPPAVDAIRAQFEATAVQGFVGCCQAIRELDYIDRLTEIQFPTLIIVGAEDMGTPVEASRAMQERIHGSRLVILQSAAHLSNVEQPEEFNSALMRFLTANEDER